MELRLLLPWAAFLVTGLSVFKARVLKRKNVSLSIYYMFAHRYSSVTGRTLIMCRFARLNAAISVNLKPNEDGEYAEVQKHICHFCFYLLSVCPDVCVQ